MHMTVSTIVRMAGRDVTAYGGPSSWEDVPVGIYFSYDDVTAIFGPVVPKLKATGPDGKEVVVASGWTITRSLAVEGRQHDWRAAMLATQEADEKFGNVEPGYEWMDLIWGGTEQ